ncbi:hypothetical protein M3J09_012141 [Ascochyta lentis]
MSSPDTAVARPAKRNRITIACTWCRQRKSRCDGLRPKCSACRERDGDCVYSDVPTLTKKSLSRELLEDFRSCLETLESSVARIDERVKRIEGVGYESSVTGTEQQQPPPTTIPDRLNHNDGEMDIVEGQNTTDGIGSFTFAKEEDSGYFGPSSNIAFTRQIIATTASILKSAAPGASPVPPNYDAVQSYILHRSRAVSPMPDQFNTASGSFHKVEAFALPPEKETLLLIERYFRTTGVLFPYIDEKAFLRTYREVASTNIRTVRRSWLGLLNMVIAMSIHVSPDSEISTNERAIRSGVFFSRAMALCDKQIRHGTSLEVVQLLLLMSQYLQGTDRSIETWNIHGLAVKAAYQLGLHSPNALKLYPNPEREVRKRTWFGCVLLDRTLSMTFGRPSSIPDKYVKLDLPSADAMHLSLSPNAASSSVGDASSQFYAATITLYIIMGEIVDLLYGDNLGCEIQYDVFDLASTILQFEQKFVVWQRSLPTNLSILDPTSINSGTYSDELLRLRFVLTFRYLNLRILTHRPILCRYLDVLGSPNPEPQQLKVLRQVGANSLRICVQSALDLIQMIRDVLSPPNPRRHLLGAWWFALYYTFNAALIVYSALLVESQAKLQDQLTVFTTHDLTIDHLQQAVECLSLLSDGTQMIEKCVQYTSHLAQLLSVIMNRQSGTQQSDLLHHLPANSTAIYPIPPFQEDAQAHGLFDFADLNDMHLGMSSVLEDFFGADFSHVMSQ